MKISGKMEVLTIIESESVFSQVQVRLQSQKSVHVGFLFTVVLFTLLHQQIEQFPENIKKIIREH